MKHFRKLIATIAVLCPCLTCLGEDAIALPDTTLTNTDTAAAIQCARSKHDIDTDLLDKLYAEMQDINAQIKDTHNWLVDLNFMSPGVERKIQLKIDGLNDRLDKASSQLDSITDKDAKVRAKPYRVSVKDCKQMLSKCSSLLKKKARK